MVKMCAVILLAVIVFAPDSHEQDRRRMVQDQIASRDITDPATLRAMRAVPRHEFVPPSWIDNAYDDRPLPIGYGQTMSQPYIVAYMTELLRPKSGQRVLEIGTGSGYQAAVLAEIVDSVFTIEIITQLAQSAEKRLSKLGYNNVLVKNADGYFGWKEKGPFDAIIVTAAAEFIPPPLVAQLKDRGKMIIPVGMPYFVQNLVLVEKKGGDTKTQNLIPVRFVPFTRGK